MNQSPIDAAEEPNARSQPRTVETGRPHPAAILRRPHPSAVFAGPFVYPDTVSLTPPTIRRQIQTR